VLEHQLADQVSNRNTLALRSLGRHVTDVRIDVRLERHRSCIVIDR
jgi:hypothetical protein